MSYWSQRLNKQSDRLYDKTVYETEEQLARYYRQALKAIQEDVSSLYDELEVDAVKGNIRINDLYRYDRYFLLMNEVNDKLTKLGREEIKIYDVKLLKMYEGVQQIITQVAPQRISQSFVATNSADNVVKSVWCADGKHWSDRIWDNKRQLQNRIEKGLVDSVVRGVPKDKMVKELSDTFGVGFNQADRITRTEMTFVQNQSAVDRYKAAGIEEYKVVSAHDARTSEICKEQNGKVYKIDDMRVGVNCPPFHPNCRSTIVPIMEV